MGLYINPQTESKEAWLRKHAQPVDPGIYGENAREVYKLLCANDSLPLIYVLNTAFSALGVAFNFSEFKRFSTGLQGRPHKWFTATREELRKLPELRNL